MFRRLNAGLKQSATAPAMLPEKVDWFPHLETLAANAIEWKDAVALARRFAATAQADDQRIIDLLQILPRRAPCRRDAVELTYALAGSDAQFAAAIAAADAARDAGDFAGAEYNYWRGLSLYPYHGGYRVQYAHALKDQGKFLDASVHYRSALALKAAPPDVEEHLSYSLSRANRSLSKTSLSYAQHYWNSERADSSPLAAPPAIFDIQHIIELLLDRVEVDLAKIETIMADNKTIEDVIVATLREPSFVMANRNLVRLIVEARPYGAR